jgi:cytochrome c553
MDYTGVVVLVAVTIVLIGLAFVAWRAKRLWVRLAGGIPASLLAILGVVACGAALSGVGRITRAYPNPAASITVAGTPEQIALGEKYARACAGCHAANGDLPLTGRQFFGGPEGPPFGTLWAPNLTPAHLKEWSDGEIIRAIREGIGRDGRSLVIMPSKAFHSMSDADVQALVAYLRSTPAIEPNTPPKALNVVAALTIASSDDAFSAQAPITSPVSAPPAGPTAEYGSYLATTVGCRECHGENLQGAIPPGSQTGLRSTNLVEFVAKYDEAAFIATLRTGTNPEGKAISDEMPWRDLEKFTDDDLRAIYRLLKTL